MAILKNGINGGFSGKVGDVVGYIANGKTIIRAKPKLRTSPPTEAELRNRKKFAVVQEWFWRLTDILRIGFQDYNDNFQGFVAAKSYNQKHALEINENGEFFINPELVLVSYGTLPAPSEMSVESRAGQELAFNWNKKGPYAYNDHLMVLAYDVDSKEVHARYRTSLALMKDASAVFKLAETEKGRAFHIYAAFVSEDRKQRSNSKYLGKLTII